MIGRIQDKNVSVPLNEAASSQGVIPNGENFVQDSEDRPAPKLGVGNAQDGFDKVQDDMFNKLGLGAKTIVDPIGYPGEEWLWKD